MKLTPYLAFDGTCTEAFRHYGTVFGAEPVIMTFRGSPMEAQCSPDQLDRVMHARVDAKGVLLMGSDVPGQMYKPMQGISVSIGVDSIEEAERVWSALSPEGHVVMPLAETFWAHRFGMVVDRFGTPWMINCEKPMG